MISSTSWRRRLSAPVHITKERRWVVILLPALCLAGGAWLVLGTGFLGTAVSFMASMAWLIGASCYYVLRDEAAAAAAGEVVDR